MPRFRPAALRRAGIDPAIGERRQKEHGEHDKCDVDESDHGFVFMDGF